ncbi:MAG: SMI1/KNR4 family protein [Campylobacterales bacterium]|nr:SMI1/KNR4 family protein [Campylobacterales bacterium]
MKNKIIQSNPYGPINLKNLESFEKQLKIRLPQEYREFLVKHNGGKLEKNMLTINESEGGTSIHHIYALVDNPLYASMEEKYKIFNTNEFNFGNEYLAIMDDSFGNQILLKLQEPNLGAIYFWDHESNDNFIKISNNFYEFIDSLEEEKTLDEMLEKLKLEDPRTYEIVKKSLDE